MPPRIDLFAHKELINELIQQQRTHDDIRAILRDTYQLYIGRTAFKSRIQEWGLQGPSSTASKARKSAAIQERVDELLPRFNSRAIHTILEDEGLTTSDRTLQRTRKRLGVNLRLDNPQERVSLAIETIHRFAQEDCIGEIESFGYKTAYLHFRRMRLFYRQDDIYRASQAINPDAVISRRPGSKREKGTYVSPGPNDVWHVDGHMKLEPFGIEIYAAIDGYSRYMIWVYIGVSARTAVSVERQYLDCITRTGFQPRVIRSDRGTETQLMADAHYEIRRFEDPIVDEPGKCYWFGRSVDNQRIEAWWGQLSNACTGLFHVSYIHPQSAQFLHIKRGRVMFTRPDLKQSH